MNDVPQKLFYLTENATVVNGAAQRLTHSPHFARILARALFLNLDTFIVLARFQKNRWKEQTPPPRAEDISLQEQRIARLEKDYKDLGEKLRDKAGAHQQAMNLSELIESWHEVHLPVVTILAEDMVAVVDGYKGDAAMHGFILPAEVTSIELDSFCRQVPDEASEPITFGTDRLALGRSIRRWPASCSARSTGTPIRRSTISAI